MMIFLKPWNRLKYFKIDMKEGNRSPSSQGLLPLKNLRRIVIYWWSISHHTFLSVARFSFYFIYFVGSPYANVRRGTFSISNTPSPPQIAKRDIIIMHMCPHLFGKEEACIVSIYFSCYGNCLQYPWADMGNPTWNLHIRLQMTHCIFWGTPISQNKVDG